MPVTVSQVMARMQLKMWCDDGAIAVRAVRVAPRLVTPRFVRTVARVIIPVKLRLTLQTVGLKEGVHSVHLI